MSMGTVNLASSWRMIWVFLAILRENRSGVFRGSSKGERCMESTPPTAAEKPSLVILSRLT
ncbi:MAG: hypothetical protein BWY86_01035 [Candidatus Aminicenantes bacterium ADurb.Bin508]|nr:MAG: hypothetical protein BWY86_01035 [Candidatus Aminicenantes bacterium ADurb.Bin508]